MDPLYKLCDTRKVDRTNKSLDVQISRFLTFLGQPVDYLQERFKEHLKYFCLNFLELKLAEATVLKLPK